MKRLEKYQSRQFGPVRLTLDDLAEVVTALEPADTLRIVADSVEYETVDELASNLKGKSPQSAEIETHRPYLKLELHQQWTRIATLGDDAVSSGMFFKISNILLRAQRRPRLAYSVWRPVLFFMALQIAASVTVLSSARPCIYTAMGLLAAWYVWANFVLLTRHSLIVTHQTNDARGFFRRNADTIVVAVISAVLGAFFGAAATKLADKLVPNEQPKPAITSGKPAAGA